MKPKDDADKPPAASGPLGEFVDEKLNKPLAEQIAEELEDRRGGGDRSGTTDYAHGTAEHEDDRET